ncbi:penicillin-binding protein activator [Marinobacterium sp. AK62]|uniref:Penicillin-binding protein activator n=1 Tax=Marinobacterium alkalitolerans TaxID=1542925 RepID=A0ABS3Z6Z1_9GAMM|nr:penicillin-binding protein activator [Marinobacterium alkalitolerans]MBP0047371.1 penicillin-binding protein activator [Marinobacterium alkalitolerans]
MTILHRLSFGLLLTAALVSGCSTPQKPPQVVDTTTVVTQTPQQLLAEAASQPPVPAARLRLRAAQMLLEADQQEPALNALREIELTSLPPELLLEVVTLRLPIENDANARLMLEQLDRDSLNQLPAELQAQMARLRAGALLQQNNPLAAARELMLSSQLSLDPDEQQQYHNQIWQTLLQVPESQLRNALAKGNDYFEQGWFELALMLRPVTDLPAREKALSEWRLLWESHPAIKLPPEGLMGIQMSGEILSANRIGVILPLTGDLATPAAAIREGMDAALEVARQQGQPTPTLVNIDSSRLVDASQILPQVEQLNLDLLIGPLDSTLIEQLALMPDLNVPVLALNPAPEGPSTPWQLELSSEHEARTVAEQALNDGHTRFLVITPNAPWGERVRDTLRASIEQAGGQIVGTLAYDARANYDHQVAQLMMTDASQTREDALRKVLRHRLEFQERRRQDADAILMTALPDAARLIKPMLDYHFAADLPVYATSHLYPGHPDATRDVDLNGIRFCDLPWILQAPSDAHRWLSSSGKNTLSRFGRLYALGIDTIEVYPWLEQLEKTPGAYIEAETGRLSMQPNRRLKRQLACTEFKDGIPASVSEYKEAMEQAAAEASDAAETETPETPQTTNPL